MARSGPLPIPIVFPEAFSMKKVLVAILALALLAGGAFAQKLEPLMAPGDLAVTAGVGYGFFWGAVDVSGGVELILGQFKLGDVLPLTYGVAGKASYYSWNAGFGTDYQDTYLGGGAFATLHLGLKDVELPAGLSFLKNVDTYVGLGAGFYNYTWGYTGYTSTEFRVGLRSSGGMSYFFTPNLAVTFEGGYYGYYSSGLIGLLFKL